MYKYFERNIGRTELLGISTSDIQRYRVRLTSCMQALGASDADLSLVHDELIQNSILNKINPEDTAWAILQ